jgi:hypothetical protein
MDRDRLEHVLPRPTACGTQKRNGFVLWAAALVLVAACGCSVSAPFTKNDFGQAMPANAPVEEVVRRVNANIERLQAWRSNDVRISGQSLPVHLGGHIAVEAPRNFRLTAGILGMDEEADFGSNNDWFWFWVKRGNANGQPSYVYQAKHEDVQNSQMLSQIPFQPDWLMEALGVVPIDPQHVTLRAEPHSQIVNLISERLSPSGQSIKQVIRVDLRRGIVLSHSLYDINGNLIACARLDKHYPDKATGIPMPHLIALEWPQADLKINLEIGQIDVNPTSIPPQNWVVPRKPYYPAFDIGARTRRAAQIAGATSAPTRDADASSAAPTTGGPPSDFGAPSPVSHASGQGSTPRSTNGGSWPEATGSEEWSKPIEGTPSTSMGTSRANGNPFDRDLAPQSPANVAPARGPSADDSFSNPATSAGTVSPAGAFSGKSALQSPSGPASNPSASASPPSGSPSRNSGDPFEALPN